MALTGIFNADFAPFSAAVDGAVLKLRDIESGSAKVETSLNRMGNSFSGAKIIQDATLMAKVFTDAGGASAFTEKELARMGATGAEAVAKLRALGQDVPPGIERIAKEAKGAEGGFSGLLGRVTETAAGFLTAEVALKVLEAGFHAVVAVGKELWEATLNGAAVADVEGSFKRLTDQAGLLGQQLIGTLREGTHDTITDFELMKTVNLDLAAGMNLSNAQFGTLAQGAFALAQATGGDAAAGLEKMNDAMLTGKTKALGLIGVHVDLIASEDKYAASMGTTRDHLNEAETLEAHRIGILDGVAAATGRLGEQTDGLDTRVQQAQTSWANFENDLGKTIATSSTLESAMTGVKKILIETFGGSQEALIKTIATAVDDATIAVVELSAGAVQGGAFIVEAYEATLIVFDRVYNGLLHIESGLLQTELAAVKVKAFAEPWNDWSKAISDLEGHIVEVQGTITENQKAVEEHEQAEAKWAVAGQNLADKLTALKERLVEGRQATADFVGPINQTAAAHAAATAGANAQGEAVRTLSATEQAAADKLKAAWVEVNSAGVTWQATVANIDGATAEWAKSMLAAGVSLDTVATVTGRTATEVKALNTELKIEVETTKLLAIADAQYYANKDALVQTDFERIQRVAQATYDFKVKEAKLNGITAGAYYDRLWATYQQDVAYNQAAEVQKTATSRDQLVTRAREADQHYAYMLDHINNFNRAEIDSAREAMRASLDAVQEFGSGATTVVDALAVKFNQFFDVVIKKADDMVRALDGSMMKLDDYKKMQLAGGSVDVTSVNLEQTLQNYMTGFSSVTGQASHGLAGSVDKARALAQQGYSFADIIGILTGAITHPGPPAGPRIPGFAGGVSNYGGGWATVGEQGPETMFVPRGSSIFPNGSPASGPTVVQVTTNLVVDSRVLATIVNTYNAKAMKQERQFPAR